MKDKIIELRKKGHSYNEIVRILNCSKSTISYHCSKLETNEMQKESNIEIKNKRQRKNISFLLETNKIDEVINLRKDEKTFNEIREITKLSKHIISKICREYGLSKRGKYGRVDDIVIKEIIKLYNEVRSTRKVAKLLNVSRDSVMKYAIYVKKDKLSDDELNANKTKSVIEWRKRTKIKLVEYKGGCCEVCGYNKNIKVLQFHHTNPNEKDFTIGGKSWSFERLIKEADKCILVCANCHIEIHDSIEKEKYLPL